MSEVIDTDKGIQETHESSTRSSDMGEAPDTPTVAVLAKAKSWEDDAHRAALEDNPESPERLTLGAALAVFVSPTTLLL